MKAIVKHTQIKYTVYKSKDERMPFSIKIKCVPLQDDYQISESTVWPLNKISIDRACDCAKLC